MGDHEPRDLQDHEPRPLRRADHRQRGGGGTISAATRGAARREMDGKPLPLLLAMIAEGERVLEASKAAQQAGMPIAGPAPLVEVELMARCAGAQRGGGAGGGLQTSCRAPALGREPWVPPVSCACTCRSRLPVLDKFMMKGLKYGGLGAAGLEVPTRYLGKLNRNVGDMLSPQNASFFGEKQGGARSATRDMLGSMVKPLIREQRLAAEAAEQQGLPFEPPTRLLIQQESAVLVRGRLRACVPECHTAASVLQGGCVCVHQLACACAALPAASVCSLSSAAAL